MFRSLLAPMLLGVAWTAAACADSEAGVLVPDVGAAALAESAERGAGAFARDCAGCHVAGDGFDLALFDFPDSTLFRRAVFHVPAPVAEDIIVHVNRIRVTPLGRDTPPFEVPRAADDVEFAVRLFGSDAWPAGITESDLLAIDPSGIASAVELPRWSDERSNLDWMPDAPLPAEVLEADGGRVRRFLDLYHASPSDRNAVAVVTSIGRALVAPDSDSALCRDGDDRVPEPVRCFDAARWAAAFGANHVLRYGGDLRSGVAGSTRIQDAFWDVGQIAREVTLRQEGALDNDLENWVSWHWVGWIFAPGNHASVYTSGGLARAGLPRHATFVALRSMAARPEGSPAAPKDLRTVAGHAPDAWLVDAYATGLELLELRAARGGWPTDPVVLAEVDDALRGAAFRLVQRVGPVAAAGLVERTRALRSD